VARTIPAVAGSFQFFGDVICFILLPLLIETSPPNDALRDLFVLPPRWGGLGIFNPSEQCDREYSVSVNISLPLTQCIRHHQSGTYFDVKMNQIERKSDIQSARQSHYKSVSSSIHDNLTQSLILALDLATTKGASSWLCTLFLIEHGFVLHKSVFHDALALQYG